MNISISHPEKVSDNTTSPEPSSENSSLETPQTGTERQENPQDLPVYSACGPGEFRLLELHPGRSDATLEGTLRTYRLTDSPMYVAVSYTWGSEQLARDISNTIIINGKGIVPSTKNLLTMLFDLRDSEAPRRLWIDDICINQQNLLEVNAQVDHMDEIYSRADCVVVWLARVGRQLSKVREGLDILLQEQSNLNYTLSLLGDLRVIYEHEYWSRTWIIKEIIHARRVELQWQSECVPLILVAKLSSLYRKWLLRERYLTIDVDFLLGDNCLPEKLCNDKVNKWKGGSFNSDFRTVLKTYRNHKCYDPRDKIFALLSLHTKARKHVKVDYKVTRVALLLQVLSFSVKEDGLPPYEIISFGLFLKEQLRIDEKMILDHIAGLRNQSKKDDPLLDLTTQIFFRGYAGRDLTWEEELLVPTCRKAAMALNNHTPIRLCYDNSLGVYTASKLSSEPKSPKSMCASKVSKRDLYAFGVRNHVSQESTLVNETISPFIGLSSTRVPLNHEIWQFAASKTAFSAETCGRKQPFEFLGRTFLCSQANHDSFKWDILDPVPKLTHQDTENTSQEATRSIRLSTQLFLRLLIWADVCD